MLRTSNSLSLDFEVEEKKTIARLPVKKNGGREAPRGKPQDIFAKPSDLSAEAIRAKGEAKDAIPPYGKPQGFLAKEGEKTNHEINFLSKQKNLKVLEFVFYAVKQYTKQYQ